MVGHLTNYKDMVIEKALVMYWSSGRCGTLDIKVLVVTHKEYWMPSDPMYKPIWVGNKDNVPEGFLQDDAGENIAEKNPYYCELTALYWAWKNLDAEYLGLVHYRRHFTRKGRKRNKQKRVLAQHQMETLLNKSPVLLPKPRHYWIETNWNQYAHAHNEKDLQALRRVVSRREPEYLSAFDRVMKRTWGHRFNMMVLQKELFKKYCAWLFGILFELEPDIPYHLYDEYNQRVFGFIGERLLDVWIDGMELDYLEVGYTFTERQLWIKKWGRFLKRKFYGNKRDNKV